MKSIKIFIFLFLLSLSQFAFNQTKKDGTPDKRFKANKEDKKVPLKKDGTPDKRFKNNK